MAAIEILVIGLTVGVVLGITLWEILFAEPARKERDALYIAAARRRRHDAEERLDYVRWKHPGTPYISSSLATSLGGALADNDQWSRAAHLKAVE